MNFDKDQFVVNRKRINEIVYKSIDTYNKVIKRAATSVKRAHSKDKTFRLMNYLESNRKKIERIAEDEIKKLELSYQEEINAIKQVDRVLDDIDKKYFGHPHIPNMWDWVNGNDNWKKLIGENKIIIKKSDLKTIIRKYLNESNDYDMELYFIKGDKIVTNISDNFNSAMKALKGHNSNSNIRNKYGYGEVYVCNVKSNDWKQDKITTNNILRFAKDIQKIK